MEVKINAKNFEEEVLKSDMPVLVDFFATWCGPCKMMAPVIEEIAGEYAGKIKVGVVDIDESMELAEKYSVMVVPTFKLFDKGEVKATATGAIDKKELIEKLGIA